MDYYSTITMSGYTSRYLSPDIWNLVTSVGSLETETLCAAIGVGSVQTEGSRATTSTGTSLNIVLRGKSKSYIEIRFLIHEYNINEKICQSRCLWLQLFFKENRSTKIQLHRQTHTHTHQVPCIDTAPCYHTDRPPWNCYSCWGRYHQHYTDRADSSGDCRSQVSTGHTYHLCSPPYRCTVQ